MRKIVSSERQIVSRCRAGIGGTSHRLILRLRRMTSNGRVQRCSNFQRVAIPELIEDWSGRAEPPWDDILPT